MSASVEERLRKVEDLLEIQQRLFTYSRALDSKDWDLLYEVFMPDCIFDYGESGMGAFTSLVAINAENKRILTPLASQHTISSPTIQIDGDTARSRCYGLNQHVDMNLHPNHQVLMAGWYDDDWVRTENGWRIRRRATTGVWAAGNPKVVGQQSIRGAEAVD